MRPQPISTRKTKRSSRRPWPGWWRTKRIVIAHRLSTITGADNIAVVSGGRIAARGRHEELIAQPGIYADFVGGKQQAVSWKL